MVWIEYRVATGWPIYIFEESRKLMIEWSLLLHQGGGRESALALVGGDIGLR